MRNTIFAIAVLIFTGSVWAKDYQTATLVSWEAVPSGQNCNRGILVDVHCKEKTIRAYTVRIGDRSYILQARIAQDIGSDFSADPLQGLNPGAEFKIRIDEKGNVWIPWTSKRGKEIDQPYSIIGARK